MIIIMDRTEVQAHRVSALRSAGVPLKDLDIMDLMNKENLPTQMVQYCSLLILTDTEAGTFRAFKDRYDIFRDKVYPLSKMYDMIKAYQLIATAI